MFSDFVGSTLRYLPLSARRKIETVKHAIVFAKMTSFAPPLVLAPDRVVPPQERALVSIRELLFGFRFHRQWS